MRTGHTTPPPAPKRNATGVVPRWHVLAAAVGGWTAGSWGIVTAAVAAMATAVVIQVLGQLLDQARDGEFRHEYSHIDQRAEITRALGKDTDR